MFGNPIGHSKSPLIPRLFAKQCGELMQYEAILAPVDGFADAWHAFVVAGGRGGNVTVPFKEQAFQLAEVLTDRANKAGAVNTLSLNAQGQLCGDNTDGAGLVADLQRLGAPLVGQHILLLGAGGASRGVIGPLLDAGAARITVANRTAAKAQLLSEDFGSMVTGCALTDIPAGFYPLIINATSSGLSNDRPAIDPALLAGCQFAYDMLYGKEPTAFLQWCASLGVPQQADGLGMLVGQAAEAFAIWRGKKPEVEPVIAELSKVLA